MRLLLAPALLALSLATPAGAAVTQPNGEICSFATYMTGEWDLTAVVTAGPLTIADEDDPAAVHTGTVTCSIQETPVHTDPDLTSATSLATAGVVALPPTVLTATVGWDWFYCTQIDVDGTTLYWHSPADRNVEGWWTTNAAAASCDSAWEHSDLRTGEDSPYRYLYTALYAPDTIGLVRSPGGAVLGKTPLGWTCADVHTGLAVSAGDALTVPDPGVSCVPPTTQTCWRAEVTGVLAPTTLGRVAARATCGTLAVERWLIAGQARVAQDPSSVFGRSAPPMTCTTSEDTPAEPAYVVVCGAMS